MFLASIRMFVLLYTYFAGIAWTGLHWITLHQGWQKCLQEKNNHDAFTRHGYCIAIQFYFVRSCFISVCSVISPGFHPCRHHSGISL